MGNRTELLNAAKTKHKPPTTPKDARGRIKRLERKLAREGRRLKTLKAGSEVHVGLAAKLSAMDERLEVYRTLLGRMTRVSDTDRILDIFLLGKRDKRLATQVDDEAEVGSLKRTQRILTSLKREGRFDNEFTSLMEGDRRVRRRWWWRVK